MIAKFLQVYCWVILILATVQFFCVDPGILTHFCYLYRLLHEFGQDDEEAVDEWTTYRGNCMIEPIFNVLSSGFILVPFSQLSSQSLQLFAYLCSYHPCLASV